VYAAAVVEPSGLRTSDRTRPPPVSGGAVSADEPVANATDDTTARTAARVTARTAYGRRTATGALLRANSLGEIQDCHIVAVHAIRADSSDFSG
jgi:hypothetical protein